jgi:hypothetical protein
MLWMWLAIGAAAWLLAAVVVGVVLSRVVRLRDHMERPRDRVREPASTSADHRDSAHRAS